MLGGSLTFPERIRDLTGLEKLTARCLTLDLPQWKVLRRSRSGATCVQPHQKVLGKGAHKQGLRFTLRFTTEFQEGWGMSPEYSGPVMSSWKSESARCHHANLPSSAEVWGKSFLLLENHRGFTFLNKTEKKASTENTELKGITILFVEDIKSPRYIRLTCLHLPNGAGCFWGLFKH